MTNKYIIYLIPNRYMTYTYLLLPTFVAFLRVRFQAKTNRSYTFALTIKKSIPLIAFNNNKRNHKQLNHQSYSI